MPTLGTIAKIRDGAAGWRLFVSNMVLRGAQLTAGIDTVVNYLALNLGPGAICLPQKPSRCRWARQGIGRDALRAMPRLERVAASSGARRTGRSSSPIWSRARYGLGRGNADHHRLSDRNFGD